MFRGCRDKATHTVKIVIPDKLSDNTAGEATIPELSLCRTHAEKAKAEDFFAANPQMPEVLAGCVPPGMVPDFDNAYTEALGLETPEYAAHRAAAEQKAN